jgi:hypothetical protein
VQRVKPYLMVFCEQTYDKVNVGDLINVLTKVLLIVVRIEKSVQMSDLNSCLSG